MTPSSLKLPIIPASFFGVVLGLIGWGGSWRAAHRTWGLPGIVGETIILLGCVVWAVLVMLFAAKWLRAPEIARAEAGHPVQCCFIGLAGVTTMLVAIAMQTYLGTAAFPLFGVGAFFTLAFALWRTGSLWQGDRDPANNTPVLYLPAVAGSFVTAIGFAAFGLPDWGRLAFGAGVLNWLAVESVLLSRFYNSPEMPKQLRPLLGIQLAPPTVGAAAYVSLNPGPPDTIAFAMIGYGLFQLLLLLRLLPWIFAGGISASIWSFSFGLTALATALVQLDGSGRSDALSALAPPVFTVVSLALAGMAVRTIWLLAMGQLVPAVPPPASSTERPSPGAQT